MWLGHHFQGQKVKGQGHQAALLTAAFTYQACSCSGERGNVFTVGTYCYVAVCRRGGRLGGAKRFGAHRGSRGAGAYRGGRPPTAFWYLNLLLPTYLLPVVICLHIRLLCAKIKATYLLTYLLTYLHLHLHLYALKRSNTTYSESWENVSRAARLLTWITHSRP